MQAFCDANSLEVETPTLEACIEELALEQGHLFVRWYDFDSESHFITRREELECTGNNDLNLLAKDTDALISIISEPAGRYKIKPELLKNGLNDDVITHVNAHLGTGHPAVDSPAP